MTVPLVNKRAGKRDPLAEAKQLSRKLALVQRDKEFRALLHHYRLPPPEKELLFALPRQWRFDYAWEPDGVKVALEVEGGVYAGKPCPTCKQRIGGRHNKGSGFVNDCQKYSEAAILGWCVLRVPAHQLLSETTVTLIRRALHRAG